MANANRCACCGKIIPEWRQVCRNCEQSMKHSEKRYSVYYKKTDMPLIIYASAMECAKAMGISIHSFYRYIMFIRQGNKNIRKWSVYEDEDELEEKDGL